MGKGRYRAREKKFFSEYLRDDSGAGADGQFRDFRSAKPVAAHGRRVAREEIVYVWDDNTESYVPPIWTGEHVMTRLIRAFQTLRRVRVEGAGPKAHGNAWPAYVHTFADIRGWADKHRAKVESEMARGSGRPSSVEIELMDESLGWPATYLADTPLWRDALLTLVWTSGYGVDSGIILSTRRIWAMAEAEKIVAPENERRRRDRVAAFIEAKEWAERKLAAGPRRGVTVEEHMERIRNQAKIRFLRAAKPLREIKPAPEIAMPDRVFRSRAMHKFASEGAAAIAARLADAGVPVR